LQAPLLSGMGYFQFLYILRVVFAWMSRLGVPLFRTAFLYFDNNTHNVLKSMRIINIFSGNFLYSDIAGFSIAIHGILHCIMYAEFKTARLGG
jgi:hypothetical protein